ncbi:MAG: glutathione S-transferase family protein [Myxococcota bacterium]|nr:glutathione S-transferase family protein [Myxococcota bacterium]
MRLYVFPGAPNPTRVRLFLAEKAEAGAAIAIEQVTVNLIKGEQRTPEHRARHPLGKLPVLELDDGSYHTESLAIIEYLEELHPEPPLCGGDPRERLEVRELERLAELGVLRPVALIVHNTNSPLGLPPNPPVADYFRSVLPDALGVLDERLSDGRRFMAGERPSIADCTLAAALQFARLRGVAIDPGFAHVLRWDARYRKRAPAKAVLVG